MLIYVGQGRIKGRTGCIRRKQAGRRFFHIPAQKQKQQLRHPGIDEILRVSLSADGQMKQTHHQSMLIGIQRHGNRQGVYGIKKFSFRGELDVKTLHGLLAKNRMLHLGRNPQKEPRRASTVSVPIRIRPRPLIT